VLGGGGVNAATLRGRLKRRPAAPRVIHSRLLLYSQRYKLIVRDGQSFIYTLVCPIHSRLLLYSQRYKLIVRDDYEWNGIAWAFSFDTTDGEWMTIKAPFGKS